MFEVTPYTRSTWSLFDELEALQEDLNRAFTGARGGSPWRRRAAVYPPVNVWSDESGLVLDFEVPGVEPEAVEVSVVGDQLTITGKVQAETAKGATVLRQERESGEFTRTLQLPFRAESAKVKAQYRNGILRVAVPRADEDKPRKVQIEAA